MFQRMRNIKQLSLGHYVYHGAEHSRFGHMIGTMHLAGKAYDSMVKNSEEFKKIEWDPIDRKTLRIAALLHDIGHPPFSHSLEPLLEKEHEIYSTHLVNHYFRKMIEKTGVNLQDVKRLISGKFVSKPYLSKIINGQLDVDRLDYLLRDSYYAGVNYGKYDLDRIIEQLCVVDNKFVILEGGYHAIEQMIFARYQMYQQVYFHKTKLAFELMLRKCGQILKDKKRLDIPTLGSLESKKGQDLFLEFDDIWFWNKISKKENPPEVKTIVEMIKNRKPYYEVYPFRVNGSSDILRHIQKAVGKNLEKMEIDQHEFLIDQSYRKTYRPVPYIKPDQEDLDSINVYYKNDGIKPIENTSHIISNMASHNVQVIRSFVSPDKYNKVKEFLEDIDISIPDR